ncbi:DEAD/DEAH box helicase family protein [Nocardioidaceae bacterium]|nr:DEAD/DEAH box helicase family protein [Nocardioidaceae bacterium]
MQNALDGWVTGHEADLVGVVETQTRVCLAVYGKDASRVAQDARNERRIAQGGYSTRQLEELIQNAVDATRGSGSRVEVLLTEECLYVANDGEPFTEAGVRAVMASDISAKEDEEIGKFGIGFKSVLAVSDSPQIFSKSVSLGFDGQWSRDRLIAAGFEETHYPVMRLGRVLDAAEWAARDADLADLMAWASTVIRLPLIEGDLALDRRLASFPAEFILFSDHVLRARFRGRGREKTFRGDWDVTKRAASDGFVELVADGKVSRWKVCGVKHQPSDLALTDGGHAASREVVEVKYALRVPPKVSLGRFWAFFPTFDETTLAGVVNAPWKLSDDRTHLLEGPFNKELLALLPSLVGDAIGVLGGSDAPMAALDAMPARGKEDRNWVDGYINEPVMLKLSGQPCIPDGRGQLRRPIEIKWVPDFSEGPEAKESLGDWLKEWAESPGAPIEQWLHPGAYATPERRHKIRRLKRLSGDDGRGAADITEWLEALVSSGSAESSRAAIALAAKIVGDRESGRPGVSQAFADAARKSRIIRLEDGSFTAPRRGRVFVRSGESKRQADVAYVDPALASSDDVKRSLSVLGVRVMDRRGELAALLARTRSVDAARKGAVWSEIWQILRELPSATAITVLQEELGDNLSELVWLRTAEGRWATPEHALLQGRIISGADPKDRAFLIDPVFHAADEDLLRKVGAVDAPTRRYTVSEEPWVSEYKAQLRAAFIENAQGRPDPGSVIVRGVDPLWPLSMIAKLGDEGRANATEHLMTHASAEPWTARHKTVKAHRPIQGLHPDIWFIKRHGVLRTSFGLTPVKHAIAPESGVDSDIFPVAKATFQSALLGLKASIDDLTSSDWTWMKARVDRWRDPADEQRRYNFYAWFAYYNEPTDLLVRVGRDNQMAAPNAIGVTRDRGVYESMLEAHVPAMFVEDSEDADDVAYLIEKWGLVDAKQLLQEEVVVETSGEAGYLLDLFPPLKAHLNDVEDHDLRLQPCSRIVRMVATPRGQAARPMKHRRDGETLFVTAASPEGRLQQVSDELQLGMSKAHIDAVFADMEKKKVNATRRAVRDAADDLDRLVAAVGEQPLRRSVPRPALDALENDGPLDSRSVAKLAYSVHGVGILKQLRSALDEAGLEPPREWSGRRTTRQWVASLGFPLDWAGFPSADRPAVELVDGPAVLPPLHEYQGQVTRRITHLLEGGGPDRGMVSLPTGAGKTRVTVEALVRAFADGTLDESRPLLWIAQTDELCEQAAETWAYVWRAIGPGKSLRLGRLWASNEVAEEPGTLQIVVATIQKLSSVKDRPADDYDWLTDPSVVVIDEAHTSISSSYTQVLEWTQRSTRGRDKEARRPLIGLTATPFRGMSEEETARLARRYDSNRLDRNAFLDDDDPYGELQDQQILATVRHELLDGADVRLSSKDVAEIEEFGRLPAAISEKLGEDLNRTQRVVDSIARLPEDWSVLAFAPSVENARVMAALLTNAGVQAVSVSASTEPAARKHYVEEFKAGRIRVLTNYNVFTQGFDAPKVRAVYVARPTFSPNVYQQMIGRGLRGPRNGGSEEVLIVNVKDNLDQYGDRLAFQDFEYLWDRKQGAGAESDV